MKASSQIKQYFENIDLEVKRSYKIAKQAREKGLDIEKTVSIPLAKNMAERVVGLISVVAPQIINTTIIERLTELEKQYGRLDWRIGFKIAEEIAKENFCKFKDQKEAIEIGIRTGFAYLTLGIVSAPLEGFIGIKIKMRQDGKEYFALQYAGPIRGAGGTAASTSVILADYVRVKMGYASYDPNEKEINRGVIEVKDYHDRVTNLQYNPSEEEIRFMISNLPVEIDGDPTEKIEVSNYKDLPRIETNLIRGGMALVLAEGLCQKAPKLWKRLTNWGEDFDLDWSFLKDFLKLKEKIHAEHNFSKDQETNNGEKSKKTVKANNTFIMDLVAGRPILTHPLQAGGFRLRYGRTRTSGFSASAAHPATLITLDKYIAIGTQLKNERPGKGTTITVCDCIEGPIVRLIDGEVLHLKTEDEAKMHNKNIEEILFLGDILFNYGDFSENGQDLVPAGYCPEWWALELEESVKVFFQGNYTLAAKELTIKKTRLKQIIENSLLDFPSGEETIKISKILNVPLHPDYSFYWKLISGEDLLLLLNWFKEGKVKRDENGIKKIILPYYLNNQGHQKAKNVLDSIGAPHKVINKENIVIGRKESLSFSLSFNFKTQQELETLTINAPKNLQETNGLEIINLLSIFPIRDKAGTFIGARMGRPEKAKMRKLTGNPQAMFPVGEEGGRLRSFQSALQVGKITSSFASFCCEKCNQETVYSFCEDCNQETIPKYNCRFCGDLDKDTCRHGKTNTYKTKELDIIQYFNKAKQKIDEEVVPDLIKGVRGTSNKNHYVEHLSKGILRAKHNLYVNKEGTIRYDATELPLTHFKPKEIGTSLNKLKELGYNKDIHGHDLTDEEQVLELKPQDLVLPGFDSIEDSAPKVLTRVTKFIDELLVKFYGLKPFYNVNKETDLVGHLVVGLAPHISAGLIGRIIGFSQTQGLFASPVYHAGLRRDCDGDEAAVMMLMDALLNFSRHYLPNTRGATMDAPLVITSILNPAEVDDQVHGMDVVWKYPLEFYKASLEMLKPWEVKFGENNKKIEQLGDRLDTEGQYENFGYTHPVSNLNKGVQCSAYKTLPSMQEKLFGQMEIAKKVRAVDMDDVAKLVIQKHFLKDIKGNLRKFSMQQFRCVKCNLKYRRPPLTNKCNVCGGKLIFTISHGSVIKYLGPSLTLADNYDFSPYLKQTLKILKANVDQVFGKEKDKQIVLGSFFG